MAIALIACLLVSMSYAQTSPSRFVFSGGFYDYDAFGQGSTIYEPFNQVEDTYGFNYYVEESDRYISSTVDFVSIYGAVNYTHTNNVYLQAPRLAGNNFGGGFTTSTDVYVLGPPGTHYYIWQQYNGVVRADRGAGAGTTQANAKGHTAIVNNGGGYDEIPFSYSSGRNYGGVTTSSPHPSVPGYYKGVSVGTSGWGFTFQSIDFCFPACPELLDFISYSAIGGAIAAGPCCPPLPALWGWNAPPGAGTAHPMNDIQRINRCFNYGINRAAVGERNIPGGDPKPDEWTCPEVIARLVGDGIAPAPSADDCDQGQCVIAVRVALKEDNGGWTDFHVYRRNGDGVWSHKPGGDPARLKADDPESIGDPYYEEDPGICWPGYTEFCGYFCVPCDFELPANPVEIIIEQNRERAGLMASVNIYSGNADPEWEITDASEISMIQQMIYAGAPADSITQREFMGYWGMSLAADGSIPGIPLFVRVLDGVIQIVEEDTYEHRVDSMGLEAYLISLALEQGYTHMISGATSVTDDLPQYRGAMHLAISPNPFNPSTVITFVAPQSIKTAVSVYDVHGRVVAALFEGMATGKEQIVQWNANTMPSGVYFVKIDAGGNVKTEKIALIK